MFTYSYKFCLCIHLERKNQVLLSSPFAISLINFIFSLVNCLFQTKPHLKFTSNKSQYVFLLNLTGNIHVPTPLVTKTIKGKTRWKSIDSSDLINKVFCFQSRWKRHFLTSWCSISFGCPYLHNDSQHQCEQGFVELSFYQPKLHKPPLALISTCTANLPVASQLRLYPFGYLKIRIRPPPIV